MGKVLMPGGGGWYDLDVITAEAADIRNGKVAVDRDGDPVVGVMAENQSPTAALNCGQSKVIPEGYNPGGTVTANSLASQTAGNLDANKLPTGYRGWSNGKLIEGKMVVSPVVSFSVAAYSTSQVLAAWKNPAKGPYSGVAICAKTGGYPANINDGRVYTGIGSNSALNAASTVIIGGLAAGTTYCFRIWMYCTCSTGDMYSSYLQATCMPTAHGRKVFTESEVFVVPANVRSINIHCTGGGGKGGYYSGADGFTYGLCGGGGAGGKIAYKKNIGVVPGQQINIIVGAGATSTNSIGSIYGGESSAALNGEVLVSAMGGQGGQGYEPITGSSNGNTTSRKYYGGSGGSGGGNGAYFGDDNDSRVAGNGGSDGGAGGSTSGNAGQGQGSTTKEFGTGTLYAGGGGGGGWYGNRSEIPGAGGAGGGGKGGIGTDNQQALATSGSPGTGGGGGGGGYGYSSSAGNGGSGNVIITW